MTDEMRIGYGSAPGKVIISGEHSVVYGFPAIAAAIGLRCHAKVQENPEFDGIVLDAIDFDTRLQYSWDELDKLYAHPENMEKLDSIAVLAKQVIPEQQPLLISLQSEIPISAGLGSSAAVAVATVAALSDYFNLSFSKEQISELAFSSEINIHGKPSGIDNSIATFGGVLVFENDAVELKELSTPLPLIIANTGIPRDTKKLVGAVARYKELYPDVLEPALQSMAAISRRAIAMILAGELEQLGLLMDMNQGLLDSIGVGHTALSNLIWKAREQGALGAKLTGAGGGGCMIVLAKDKKHGEQMAKILSAMEVQVMLTEISPLGVVIGK